MGLSGVRPAFDGGIMKLFSTFPPYSLGVCAKADLLDHSTVSFEIRAKQLLDIGIEHRGTVT